ncbi:stage V sporulation protein T [Anaerolentibacter hominis]|uniref:stage V sporulation protein T n=1 Tax=Anaerolentibacter hominis TaxID=3079009 RepID=UPI0031B89ECE
MKATGIVRRIDNLGRVVLPKEIRRTLRIREGDPLEIFTGKEGEIVLKKYSPVGELSQFAKEYTEALSSVTGLSACITDRDQLVAAAGPGKKEMTGKAISRQLELALDQRVSVMSKAGDKKYVKITDEEEEPFACEIICPILCEGDVIGGVLLMSREKSQTFGNGEMNLAETAAQFLGKQLEQ